MTERKKTIHDADQYVEVITSPELPAEIAYKVEHMAFRRSQIPIEDRKHLCTVLYPYLCRNDSYEVIAEQTRVSAETVVKIRAVLVKCGAEFPDRRQTGHPGVTRQAIQDLPISIQDKGPTFVANALKGQGVNTTRQRVLQILKK